MLLSARRGESMCSFIVSTHFAISN